MSRRAALRERPRPLTCFVTDTRRWLTDAAPAGSTEQARAGAVAVFEQAVSLFDTIVPLVARAGVDLIQVREPHLECRNLLRLVARCVDLTRGSDCLVVVNERLDVALAAGAHGVHLRGSSLPAVAARHLAGPDLLIGRSVHDVADIAAGRDRGADYLVAGTVFPSRSKAPASLLGIAGLAAIVRSTDVPVLAIGGVDDLRAGAVAVTGAAGIAAVDLYAQAAVQDRRLQEVMEQLASAFRRAAPESA